MSKYIKRKNQSTFAVDLKKKKKNLTLFTLIKGKTFALQPSFLVLFLYWIQKMKQS